MSVSLFDSVSKASLLAVAILYVWPAVTMRPSPHLPCSHGNKDKMAAAQWQHQDY